MLANLACKGMPARRCNTNIQTQQIGLHSLNTYQHIQADPSLFAPPQWWKQSASSFALLFSFVYQLERNKKIVFSSVNHHTASPCHPVTFIKSACLDPSDPGNLRSSICVLDDRSHSNALLLFHCFFFLYLDWIFEALFTIDVKTYTEKRIVLTFAQHLSPNRCFLVSLPKKPTETEEKFGAYFDWIEKKNKKKSN